MLRRTIIIPVCIMAVLISGCSSTAGSPSNDSGETAASESRVGMQWMESDIIGNVAAETEVSLKDDFAAYVNHDWLADTAIPAGRTYYSAFTEAGTLIRERKLSLIKNESLISHDAELVRTLFELTGDWGSRNKAGFSPAEPYIQAIQEIGTIDDLSDCMMDRQQNPRGLSFSPFKVEISRNDATAYAVAIREPEYFLNYPDDYSSMSETGQMKDDCARQKNAYMLQRFGCSEQEASDICEGAIQFETLMAQYLYTSSELSSTGYGAMVNNAMTLEDIKLLQGSYPLSMLLETGGYTASDEFIVYNPAFIKNFSKLYTEENVELMKDYLLAHSVTELIESLDYEAYEKSSEINNAVYRSSGILSNEEYCYNTVNRQLAWPLDNLYVDAYCTEEMQKKVIDCAEEIVSYYRKMLESDTWLADSTKAAAIDKLDQMTIHAVIPEIQFDYSELSLKSSEEGGTFLDAVFAIRQFNDQLEKEHIGKTVTADEWTNQTSAVNAYYDDSLNAVYVLDGILVPPFLNDEDNEAEFLSVVGCVLGHEISHAFDSNGAQYDANEDRAAFDVKTQSVVDYLNQIVPISDYPDLHIDGNLVQTEYIADLVSFQPVFAIARSRKNFDWDTLFQTHARVWRMVVTREDEIDRIQSNVHPINFVRINAILQQYQEFNDTYDIQPGDGIYLAPEERVSVW